MTQTDPTAVLSSFDGRAVMKSTVAVTNAGDGLSAAMKVDPREFHHGETVTVAIECEVVKVRLDPFDKTDLQGPLIRHHVLKAGTATIVDGDLLTAQLNDMRERVKLAKEAEQGVQRLDFDSDDERLAAEHAEGEHDDGVVLGCPTCEGATTRIDQDGEGEADDGDEDDETTVLRRNHMAGSHSETKMPGCPICDQEALDALMGGGEGGGDDAADGS